MGNDRFDVNAVVNEIIDILVNKRRLDFRRKRFSLEREIRQYAPAYRPFLLKVLRCHSVKVRYSSDGDARAESVLENRDALRKRANTTIRFSPQDPFVLGHELGHAIDLWFGWDRSFSCNVLLPDGSTLWETLNEEFQQQREAIATAISDQARACIDAVLGEGSFQLLRSQFPSFCRLRECLPMPIANQEEIEALQDQLYASGFMEKFYSFKKKEPLLAMATYATLTDLLSSFVDMKYMDLPHHELDYWKGNQYRIALEFFANSFEVKLLSNREPGDLLRQYLPRSTQAFEYLFHLFYTRLMNGKKFLDVPFRKG